MFLSAALKPNSVKVMTKDQFASRIDARARWPADNYNHLLEQPTQFYAVSLVLALLAKNAIPGAKSAVTKTDLYLAWAYVGVRILHSLVQTMGNNIPRRFTLFITSSAVLLIMTARAARTVLAQE